MNRCYFCREYLSERGLNDRINEIAHASCISIVLGGIYDVSRASRQKNAESCISVLDSVQPTLREVAESYIALGRATRMLRFADLARGTRLERRAYTGTRRA
ncbi:hypothetical protein CENSYa_0665 [Cenarchaeum symbiosum A]|uniref:Uncharacterized protein n=1 Tax=Cenarchaeum symbiosum (strain A) TaxID=414004 RepID=A0RVD1_CENSY|nr:hypothetical protein CENSYa_0665 [Cenarchaeum symbiosum A]